MRQLGSAAPIPLTLRGQLEQDAVGEVLAGRIGGHAQYGADVPGRGLLGGSLDPRRGRPHKPLGRERLGRLQRVEKDHGEGLREAGSQLGPDFTHQMRAQQRQNGACGAFGFLGCGVLTAFLHVVEECFPTHGHHGPFCIVARRTDGGGQGRKGRWMPALRRVVAVEKPACQPLICLCSDSPPIAILRGLARSAIGMRRVSTPAS